MSAGRTTARTASTARTARLVRCLVAAGALVAALATVTAPASGADAVATGTAHARAQAAYSAASTGPISVVVDSLSAVSLTPNATGPLTVVATARNTGTAAADELGILVGVGPAANSRAALLSDFTDPPGLDDVDMECDNGGCGPTTLAAGASATFTVTLTLPLVGVDDTHATVYPLIVRIDGSTDGLGSASDLGSTVTYLPSFPASVSAPLQVAWIWPLDIAPVLDASGAIANNDFPAVLGPGGSVRALLDLGQPPAGAGTHASTASAAGTHYAPVTWAIEPSLLAAAQLTAAKGWTRSGDGSTSHPTTRAADPGSVSFLADLTRATAGQDVIALPYGDPDAVAEAAAGLTPDLSTAIATGQDDVQAALPSANVLSAASNSREVQWVPQGGLDAATANAYSAAGVSTLIVDGGQLPAAANASPPTQTAVTSVATDGPTLRVLATDPDVETMLAAGGRDQPSAQMASQRLLALLATIVDEEPNSTGTPRVVVLAPPRGFDPEAAWARDVLSATGHEQWLTAEKLSATDSAGSGDREQLQPLSAGAIAAQLPASALTGTATSVSALRGMLAAVQSMLPTNTTIVRPLAQALDRAESIFWRPNLDGTAGSQQLRTQVGSALTNVLGQVEVATAAHVTLTSRTAAIPVTIENNLAEQVLIRVSLVSLDRSKLAPAAGKLVTVPARSKARVLVSASTQRAGTFPVQVVLATPSGQDFAHASLLVHSTAYGTITLIITGVALAVLVLALLRRFGLRLLRWRRARAG